MEASVLDRLLGIQLLTLGRFQRALKTGNLAFIRSAAAELPHVDLGDALAVLSRSVKRSHTVTSARP